MEHDDLSNWTARYRLRILNYHEPRYFAAGNRAVYTSHFLGKLMAFADEILECAYKRAIIDRYKEGRLLQKSLPEILAEIEHKRNEVMKQYLAAMEYSFVQAEAISDLAYKEGERPAVRYIIQCRCAEFFLLLIAQLHKAQKRGSIGLKEEHAIFEHARKGILKSTQQDAQPVIGFKLEGKGVTMRLETLYGELLKEGFIGSRTTLEQFTTIFNGSPVSHPVIWRRALTQLVFLIGAMVNHKLLHAPDGIAYGSWLYPRIIASFQNSQGQPFLSKQLSQTLHDIEKKDRAPAHREYLNMLVKRIAGMNWNDAVSQSE